MGDMPLANGFHMGEVQSRFPLNMMVCEDCYHGQLSVVVNGDIMFKNYAYMSSVSDTFREHCHALAKDAVARVDTERPFVLDIAANDGLLLSQFKKVSFASVMGVDPAKNLKPYTDALGIKMVHDFWSEKLARSINTKFDIITAQNVFAHVDDPQDFLDGCEIALKDDGVLIIEFAYCLNLIADNEFDTIYHEHLSYFLVNSFATLVKNTGFYIDDVLRTPIHGGSIRFYLKKKPGENDEIVNQLIAIEAEHGLFQLKTYERFRENVEKNKQELRKMIAIMRANEERVVGYCASAKGITMLNYFDIDLDYIVDDTTLKQGRLIPGKDTPVLKPLVLGKEKKKLNIVILAWNFIEEIKQRIRTLRGTRDNLVIYVPEVEKVRIS